MHLTWLDSNSWLIELGGQRILLDPWLVGDLVFGNLPWLFKGTRTAPRSIPDNIDLILLSQGLEDHAHPQTLQQFDRQIPVVASPNAAKVVNKLGYTQVTALAHGERFTLADRVTIEATPGSPIGPLLVENGYLLSDQIEGTRLYYEPHGYHSATIKAAAPVDIVITPIANLEIPLLGAIIQGKDSIMQVVEWLQPQIVLPTAAGGDVNYQGVLAAMLHSQGTAEELQAIISDRQLQTQVITPIPGQRFAPQLATPA